VPGFAFIGVGLPGVRFWMRRLCWGFGGRMRRFLDEFGMAILSTVVILAVAFFYSGIMEAIGWRLR
jgi:hypothetical protein